MKIKSHLNRNIPPQAHTPMYNWHKFWSRKTWNVVGEFIKAYSPERGVVLDPFSGSGVTALEALRNGRRVIACDLLPIATEILRLTVKPVPELKIQQAFEGVTEKVKEKILSLYLTQCRKCRKEIPMACAIWKGEKCQEVRYICPCGDREEKNCELTSFDKKLLEKIESAKIKEWYPKNPLYYPDGQPFMKKEKFESLDQMFTKRNLQALAWLMEAIEEEPSRDLRAFLKGAFSSMVHLCSRLLAEGEPGYRPFSGVGWNQQSYWFVPRYMESNVWEKFESSVLGHQGIIKAKVESNSYFKDIRFGHSVEDVLKNRADIYIHTGPSFDLMEKMPEECIDYIFTDPPYDAAIQFGELAYLWIAWLKMNGDYLESLLANEVVRNERQGKNFAAYHALLSRCFGGMFKALKPDGYLTVTFHNPTFKVRNATIRAGVFSGFDFEKVHHQELARPSAKSLLQPFGSAQGDFYLRFHRPGKGEGRRKLEEITEDRFERIVVETTKEILADRAEPTPYTLIINYIDPRLAKEGYFSSLHTGLDIKTVLTNNLDKEFELVKGSIGDQKGQLWWFKDRRTAARLTQIPLSERVEQAIYRLVSSKGRVTFTEAWDRVSTEFPNSLTPDQMSIKEALAIYARPVSKGYWMLKPELQQRATQHNAMIVLLAEAGKASGHLVWIGKKEQSESYGGKKLKEWATFEISKISDCKDKETVSQMDVLWIDKRSLRATSAFEVEFTTAMTSALLRGSNLNASVPKYLVIPEERERELERKMKSPLFEERFKKDNWGLLYFNTLYEKVKDIRNGKLPLSSLSGKKTGKGWNGEKAPEQTDLALEFR